MSDRTACLSCRPEDWAHEIEDIFARVAEREPEASFDDSPQNLHDLADLFRADVDRRLLDADVHVVWTTRQSVGVGALVQWASDDTTTAQFHRAVEAEAIEWIETFIEEVRRDA